MSDSGSEGPGPKKGEPRMRPHSGGKEGGRDERREGGPDSWCSKSVVSDFHRVD